MTAFLSPNLVRMQLYVYQDVHDQIIESEILGL